MSSTALERVVRYKYEPKPCLTLFGLLRQAKGAPTMQDAQMHASWLTSDKLNTHVDARLAHSNRDAVNLVHMHMRMRVHMHRLCESSIDLKRFASQPTSVFVRPVRN